HPGAGNARVLRPGDLAAGSGKPAAAPGGGAGGVLGTAGRYRQAAGRRRGGGRGASWAPWADPAKPLHVDEGVVGLALTEGRPVWTADVLGDPRVHLLPESRRWIAQIGGTRARGVAP